jgi:hypothetical protein
MNLYKLYYEIGVALHLGQGYQPAVVAEEDGYEWGLVDAVRDGVLILKGESDEEETN